jgi:site-specific DNA recombinase
MRKLRLGYARVSTSSGEQLTALSHQRGRLVGAGVDEVLEDVQSGRESDRSGYLELLERVASGAVAEVVITRVDRLGRDATDTDAAIAFCAKHGVQLTALDGGVIEVETPGGFVMSRILTTLAEMESRMLSQRIKAGLAQGRKVSRPLRGRAPWGYAISSDKQRFEPHPTEWGRAAAFLALMRSMSWRMEPALRQWAANGGGDIPLHSCRAVRAWLMNPVLRGGIGYRQQANHQYAEIVWGTHEPLLPPAEWESVQLQLEQNRRMWGSNSRRKPRVLTGLCRCGHCGRSMVYAPAPRRIPALMCKHFGCEQRYKSIHEALVIKAINEALRDHAVKLATAISVEPPEIKALREQIAYLEALGDPDLQAAIAAKQERIMALSAAPAIDTELVAFMQDPHFLPRLPAADLHKLYRQLVSFVEIRNKQVAEVRLSF